VRWLTPAMLLLSVVCIVVVIVILLAHPSGEFIGPW
jgi:preprotein translocase subunit SecG